MLFLCWFWQTRGSVLIGLIFHVRSGLFDTCRRITLSTKHPSVFSSPGSLSLRLPAGKLSPVGVVRLFLLTRSRYCSSLSVLYSVSALRRILPQLPSLFSLAPSFPASLTSLSSPHEILQYASKLTDTYRVSAAGSSASFSLLFLTRFFFKWFSLDAAKSGPSRQNVSFVQLIIPPLPPPSPCFPVWF